VTVFIESVGSTAFGGARRREAAVRIQGLDFLYRSVAFVILENGSVETLRVIKSSGHDLLDESVVKTVRALQPFPRPPTRAEVVVPIAFGLE